MSELAKIALGLGGAIALLGAWLAAAPEQATAWIRRFPRNRWAGGILATVDLLWSAGLLYNAPLESFDNLKPLLYILTPVSIFLVIQFMDDLLAARAFGGLLVLIPAPLLEAARWNPSPWRLVVTLTAYALAIKGIALILSPYLLRRAADLCLRTERTCRWCGFVGLSLGVALAVLAFAVY